MSVPIVLFVYNRPDKTQRILSAIRNQSVQPALLIVFSDGAKNANDAGDVYAVRKIIYSIDWIDKQVFERTDNLGCAPNIIQGLTEVFSYQRHALILEDDTLPSTHFYESLCKLLEYYSSEKKVFSVGGYPNIKSNALKNYRYDVIISKRFSCWGWGTWGDRWKRISSDLIDFRNPFEDFDSVPDDAGFDLPLLAKTACASPGSYWDIPVAISCLKLGMLHVHTRDYLIKNIGLDSGTHGSKMINKNLRKFMDQNNQITYQVPESLPEATVLPEVRDAVQQYVRKFYSVQQRTSFTHQLNSWLLRVKSKAKAALRLQT